MIRVRCARCTQELDELGGLLFSPPEGDRSWKHHLCVSCYDAVGEEIDRHREKSATDPGAVASVGAV